MSRARLSLIALGTAFALPALTGAHGSPEDSSLEPSSCSSASQTVHEDARWKWRLSAYRHLDCVTEIINAALAKTGPHGVDEQVTIPRSALERIRAHAWWARDAAARIGH